MLGLLISQTKYWLGRRNTENSKISIPLQFALIISDAYHVVKVFLCLERPKMNKKCKKCGEFKSIESFGRQSQSKDGRRTQCKQCLAQKRKERRIELTCQNPECGVDFTHCREVKYCQECSPERMLEKRLSTGKKKCTKCRIEKNLTEFFRSNKNKDGRASSCAKCETTSRKQVKHLVICAECSNEFISTRKVNKFCNDCRPRKPTRSPQQILEDIASQTKECTKCSCRKNFSEFSVNNKHPDGRFNYCRSCQVETLKRDIVCQNANCGNVFVSKRGRKKFCYVCSPEHCSYTDQELQKEMEKHGSRIDFQRNSPNPYSQAYKKDWYKDFAQELWGDPIEFGFSRSDFIDCCKRNNNGLGILYLIKCFGNGEMFYKIGITSLSVGQRYGHDGDSPNKTLPYNYEILWTIEADGGQIFDMENWFKRETSKIRYQPKLWAGKSTETFKCHGNCKILRKPIKNSLNQK